MEKVNILGVNIDVTTPSDALNKIFEFIEQDSETKKIYTPNPEFIMNARKDEEFKNILNEGDLVIADGSGIIYASKLLHNKKIQRVTGFDTVSNLFEIASDGSITFYILGGKEGVANQAKENLEKQYPNLKIVGTHHGYFKDNSTDEQELIEEINRLCPDVLFVGLGSPRQEKWINRNNKLNTKVAMGVGGSFDIFAGNLKRAPKFVQKIGFEWLYRFILEPTRYKRIFKLFKFAYIVIVSKLFGIITNK